MPAQGAPLTAGQIATIKTWIDRGAKWDAATMSSNTKPSAAAALAALENRPITPEERNYWAFKLPVQAPLPVVDNKSLTNPIDGFERARQEHGLKAAPQVIAIPWSAALPRCVRLAADAGPGGRLHGGSLTERVGASHRHAAGLAALRRALAASGSTWRVMPTRAGSATTCIDPMRGVPRLRHQVFNEDKPYINS